MSYSIIDFSFPSLPPLPSPSLPPPHSQPVSVENTVAAARQETARVAGEMMEEKIREHQEAQMSDKHLSWLKESAQVRRLGERDRKGQE